MSDLDLRVTPQSRCKTTYIYPKLHLVEVNMAVNTLLGEGKTRNKTSAFNSFDGRDMLILLKDLALEPCNMKSSHQRFQSQMLRVRKFLTASARRPQRKRKFTQYKNDSKLLATFGTISQEKYGTKNAKNQRRDESSSICSPLSKEKLGSLQGIQKDVAFPAQNDRAEYCSLSGQDYSDLTDSDESIRGPNPMNKVDGITCIHSTESSIKEETNMEFLDVLKSSVNEDVDILSEASHSLSSEKEETELSQPLKNCLPSRFNHFLRLPIPIGPRFQAEIPKWECTSNTKHHNCDDLKWLGTQIWPLPDIAETNARDIGKGRSDSCTCDILGSDDCVRQHVREARKLLQSEIGTAFSSWKFDEMGEDVSKSWTLKEQKEFESLSRLNLPSDDKDFWKLAMENFPAKSMKSLVSYYYNVYIPRRMSMETRSSSGELESDNDQSEDYRNEHGCSTRRIGVVPICKLLKSRIRNYL